MTEEKMKRKEALLLQRYVDGEARGEALGEAKALLEELPAARVYVSVLESLAEGVRAAEAEVWERAELESPETWARLAHESQELVDETLDELAPLLERFHDGEVGATERAVVLGLIDERDDVAAYLEELQSLSQGVQHLEVGEEVDFDGFWEGIAAEIGADEGAEINGRDSDANIAAVEAFEPRIHTEMVQRYHDGEVDAAEKRQVEAWLESGHSQVVDCLEGLHEVEQSVQVAIEEMLEEAPPEGVWEGVEEVINAEASGKVVDLRKRDEAKKDRAVEAKKAKKSLFERPIFAVAAAVALVTAGALIGPLILGGQAEEIQTERIVIFDSIESAPGSSVMVRSPQLADHGIDSDVEIQTAQEFGVSQPAIQAEDDEAPPTVLWLMDDEDEDDDEESDELPGPI